MRCPASNSRRRVMNILVLIGLSGADYTPLDFQSRGALQKFPLRLLVFNRTVTQIAVAFSEIINGVGEFRASRSDACCVVLRAFVCGARQSGFGKSAAQLEPCGLHLVRLASVKVAQHEQCK